MLFKLFGSLPGPDETESAVVLIAGKGCEPYQEISGTQLPFLDSDVGREALEASR